MEMLQSKGYSSKIMEEERIEYERMRTRNIELETRLRHLDNVLEVKEKEILKVRLIIILDQFYSINFFFILIFNY